MSESFDALVHRVERCRICEANLPLGPRPVFSIHEESRILIVGQGDGVIVSWDEVIGTELLEETDEAGATRTTIEPHGHTCGFGVRGTNKPGKKE